MNEFLSVTWQFGAPVLAAVLLLRFVFMVLVRRDRRRHEALLAEHQSAAVSFRRWVAELPEIDGSRR